ncbi:MAG: phosphate/phosphite/phosphonate ABC transporter substrate-binding protein [Pseudomonadota bacterium]|nr:phosphate/phosphite/phosphonate ABC transporter substrate-binding protein [Pseudomonadota bacterium]
MKFKALASVALAACSFAAVAVAGNLPDGSASQPLRVMMVPADTGGADVTQDYKPVFDAIAKQYGIHFNVMAGDSYAAVVKGLCTDNADIAWYGPVTFGQAKDMCGAELLAVDVKKGEAVYFSGIYARKDSGMDELTDLKGRSLAVGSVHSTSSFNFPMAMIIAAGVDPVKDLGKIVVAGSHTNSIAALKEGRVDAAAASFNSWEKAVNQGIIDPAEFKVLAKSEPIPNPPLAMNPKLDPELKAKLRNAFNNIHKHVNPGLIRGYGGKQVDRYDADYPEDQMLAVLAKLSKVTDELKAEIVDKAGQR